MPKKELKTTLFNLYGLLNAEGRLICEECDLYKAFCANRDKPNEKVELPFFNKWLELSNKVQQYADGNDFSLGQRLASIMQEITGDVKKVSEKTFQPVLDTPDSKLTLFYSMRTAGEFLVNTKLKRKESYEDLTGALQNLAEDNQYIIHYMENHIVIAKSSSLSAEDSVAKEVDSNAKLDF